jgi:hypothetical protein
MTNNTTKTAIAVALGAGAITFGALVPAANADIGTTSPPGIPGPALTNGPLGTLKIGDRGGAPAHVSGPLDGVKIGDRGSAPA